MNHDKSEFYNVSSSFYKVDGKIWFSTRHIKDCDGNEQIILPWSSFLWNNFFFICNGIKEILKILLGASVLVALIKNGILGYIFK